MQRCFNIWRIINSSTCKRFYICHYLWLSWKYIKFLKRSCVLNCCSEHSSIFSWCRNEWRGWYGSSIHYISSLQKYKLRFFSLTDISWAWKNMFFMNEYRKCQDKKSYNMEMSCNEIMHNFFIFIHNIRIQQLKNWLFIYHMFTSLEKWLWG